MRLDMDCVRDILLCVEENTGLRKVCHFTDSGLSDAAVFLGDELDTADYQTQLSKKYENDKLIYHLQYCIEAGLLHEANHHSSCCIWISDLTPAGHGLLNNIREAKIWGTVKNVSAKVGATSISALSQIATAVVSELIKSALPQFFIP